MLDGLTILSFAIMQYVVEEGKVAKPATGWYQFGKEHVD
jgi:hypothetical protein